MKFPRNAAVKRFYTDVSIACENGGYIVCLDGRPLKTPARKTLWLPAKPLAEAVASEWRQQGETIIADTIPVTKLVNSALDAVAGKEEDVRKDIVRYASSDLVCYRAAFPAELASRQAAAWDLILTWARERFGGTFILSAGINYTEQPVQSLEAIRGAISNYSPFQLTALHAMTTLTGSALIPLAHVMGMLSLDEAWAAAHVDEAWQIAQWGEDHDDAMRLARRLRDMTAASQVFFAA